ncbi:NEW3 domain-containing protein [Halohasta salina]|uniref:COG1470 family protein n=1 Tax=Halohasta salina TaxID=2961621 RepID=UPI0020A5D691|nr:NEW3 domain-containing protein [Halohasta salina]
MQRHRRILIALVVVGAVATIGAVTVTAQSSSSTSAATAGEPVDPGNYTRLYVEDGYRNVELKPGESDTVTVTVENGEDESVELSPQVASPPPQSQRPVDPSWVSIDAGDTSLDAGESREFEITVDVPDDAEIGDYRGVIAFTDETVRYPGRPPQPVHSVSLSTTVWQEPTVQIDSETHVYTQLQAGETFTREITVSNTGEQAVPVAPQFEAENQRRGRPTSRDTLDRSWVSIDAPSEVGPGETDTIELTVEPPADADRGDYRGTVDLGITDPTRADDNNYWQQVDLNFQLWTEPDEPFETSFDVSESATNATLELSANRPRTPSASGTTDFDVTFVAPDGSEVDAERSRVTDSGRVGLGAQRRPTQVDDTYAARGSQQTFTYELSDPEAGEWSVRIMPENTMDFEYEISRSEKP